MARMRRLAHLWRNVLRRARVERDLDDELRAFVELSMDENVKAGMSPLEARRAALIALGGAEPVKEQIRTARAGAFMDSLLQDLRYAARLLRRSPVFTLTATMSIAVGVGAVTAVFTVGNGVLLRSAEGVSEPQSLVDIVAFPFGVSSGFTPILAPHYEAIREQATTLEGVFAYALEPRAMAFTEGGSAERVFATLVTPSYFQVLGVRSATGRMFTAGDVPESVPAEVAVLSHDFWTRRFHGDPTVIGKTLRLAARSYAVIGVAPATFRGMSVVAPDVWLPATAAGIGSGLTAGGRLKTGVSSAEAASEIQTIIDRSFLSANPQNVPLPADPAVRRERSRSLVRWGVVPSSPIPFGLRVVIGSFLGLLMALVGVVLLIASSNVTGVLLARAALRRREVAVRTAIGAARGRIVRQLLTETFLLFALGGTTGLLLARLFTSMLVWLLPAFPVPVHVSLPLDWHVLMFALAISLLAALVAGLTPAQHASKTDVVLALKSDASPGLDARRLRYIFVVSQVALSTVLIIMAGLLLRRMGHSSNIDRGFDASGVVTTSIDFSTSGRDARAAATFADELLKRVRALPGVRSATAADRSPDASRRSIRVAGMRPSGSSAVDTPLTVVPNWHFVAPDYFKTMKIALLKGREFTADDREGVEPVVIVSAAAARKYWPDQDPVRQRFTADAQPGPVYSSPLPVGLAVVGVAEDLKYPVSGEIAPVDIYVPFQQMPTVALTILVRTDQEDRTMASLRKVIAALAPYVPPPNIQTLQQVQTGPVETQLQIATAVAGSVGVVGLLLAVMGIHGITAYVVAQRRREFGIRLALGAERHAVVRMALRSAMTLVGSGLVIGLGLSAGAGRLAAASPIGTIPLDPLVFAGVSLLFLTVGLVACYAPARSAGRISPIGLLKAE